MKPDEVQVYVDKNREFRWRRIAPNGRIVSESGEGYDDLPDCVDGVIRTNGRSYVMFIKTDLPPESLPPQPEITEEQENPPMAKHRSSAAGLQHLPGMSVRRLDEPTFGLPRSTEG